MNLRTAARGFVAFLLSLPDAPETPSVGGTPPGVIKEGSSVNLTCTSEANPVAKYSWTKVPTDHSLGHSVQGQQLSFHPIQSSDSGQYLCTAENDLGKIISYPFSIDVKYAPKTPSVSVRPPGGIKEGGSVTLSCSSDANPAADYTWFKDNQPLLWEPSQPYTLDPVSSKDRGTYHCQAENQYGYLGSNSVFIDVLYAPKTPSVSVRPPGEIKEGGSVTLSCSSDANPAANYTWFKDNQPLPWEPRRPYTLDPVRSKDRGTYRCHAENQYGYLGSNSVFIDVLYAPKTPSVSVRPPGGIKEGGSVTLSCSSDANPAADHTWFKDNQPLLWEPSQPYTLDPVSSKDRGTYHCQAENQYGYLGSNSVFIDVLYAPKTPSVSVRPPGGIKEGGSVTLSCSSDANPAADYTWFKDNQPLLWEPSQPYTLDPVSSKDRGTYHCQAENQYGYLGSNSVFIDVLYAPKTPSVSVRPPGGIKEGGSVTLSCSSDANPAADYTWFKDNQPLLWEPSQPYTLDPVSSKDRGTYHCQAENQYGYLGSNSVFIDVLYAPKTPSVSVRPPGEIKEGGSVTLSCSSDANPAANYTWFKDNQPLPWEPRRPYTLDPVSSKDRGTYRCQAENQYGYLGSNSVFIDVLYAPKTPSLSVRPPGEIKEGGSVTLSCSSDANPAADYTWFREHGGSVGELGENYTISNITTELGGNHYCEARNAVGLQNSTLMFLNVTATSSSPSSVTTITVARGTVAVLLATILLLIFLWMRRKRASRKARGQGGRPDTRQESPPCPVYDNVSALTNRSASAAQREPIEEQDDPHYASIHISRSKNQEVPGGFAGALVESDHTEQVLYSAINLKRPKAVPDDSKLMSELYTTIKYMSQKMHYFKIDSALNGF
ncbi:carcinoembryonic antigen-related cell adhesion molecule 5 [Gadus morhua]|uniref:carcinoembryonic antigen-related cell adhesion molecule 5 n=1 Tax=Gadus morhua TaxID=8049 RepID=UPI0011B84051|nr:carcinoembryonic antigen-related cell adhesion molecule 5-like [Gadus morhua]